MAHHAYIDESGTMDHQEVMTVAMVVFDVLNTAEKVHLAALKEAYPRAVEIVRTRKNKRQPLPPLHYAEISMSHKLAAGRAFGASKIACYASSFYHDGESKDHETRFAIYEELVKNCIKRSFEHYSDLEILIAQQGGASEYKKDFLTRLRLLPDEYSRNGNFTKAKFDLSGTRTGIQIADFYAGATRDYLLSHKDAALKSAYELIEKQVICIDVVGYELLKSKR